MAEKMTSPAVTQNAAYQLAFDHLNDKIFKNTLSVPMLVFSQNKHIKRGMFKPEKWEEDGSGKKVHEISIGMNKLAERDIVGVFVVLIEQMVHQLQHEGTTGTPSKDGRCNRQWMDLVKSIGLKPDNDTPGYGRKCTLVSGGQAEEAIVDMPKDALFPWMNLFESESSPSYRGGKRTKYVCKVCGNAVWGRRGLMVYCRGTSGVPHDTAPIESCLMEVA